jgi:hypothetical protein
MTLGDSSGHRRVFLEKHVEKHEGSRDKLEDIT